MHLNYGQNVGGTSCNPCYSGNGVHLLLIKLITLRVSILVIMDEVYTLGEGKGFQSDIVILIIMDLVYTLHHREGSHYRVVILVIVDNIAVYCQYVKEPFPQS